MSDNPLKQYFRRPAIYITLPSGKNGYTADVVDSSNNELPVYPMTAIDEITSRTPDALYNGQAVVDIIKSCIPSIKNPWRVKSVDLDTIFIAIRIASSGETMDINCVCPKCSAESKFGVNLTQLLSQQKKINYDTPLVVRDLRIKFKPLTLEETNKNSLTQYEIQKMLAELSAMEEGPEKDKHTKSSLDHLSKLTAEIIVGTIEYIQTPEAIVTDRNHITEFMNNCDRQLNTNIRNHSVKLREDSMLPPLQFKCIQCQENYEQPLVLNITDFFD